MQGPQVHLVASPFLGGPERQLLGLLGALPPEWPTLVLTFAENGKCQPLVNALRQARIPVETLRSNAPHYFRAIGEVAGRLVRAQASVLFCHGYKPDILGYWAARRAGIPVVSVSRGWTWATWKVRLNEAVDRRHLRWMERVVCVSAGQAARVLRAGVPADRIQVIRNAIDVRRFESRSDADRTRLLSLFPSPPSIVVGALGRLSPEKDFRSLIDAAAMVVESARDVGFVLFGEGPLREGLWRHAQRAGLQDRFVFAGFREDVDCFVPHLDLVVQSSRTEGLPNVLLESLAAGVPVVATNVGGTAEVVIDGENGVLVPPGAPAAMARAILAMLADEPRRRTMGRRGKEFVARNFTFPAQARAYLNLIDALTMSEKAYPASAGVETGGEQSSVLAATTVGMP